MLSQTYPVLKPSKTWYLLAVGVCLGQLLYLVLLYPSLPDPYPIHYGLSGEVNGLVAKSPLAVFWLTCLFFPLIGLVWWLAGYMGRQVAQDAAAQQHDAFSPHASRLNPRQSELAQKAGLPASVYSARRLYAQTQATLCPGGAAWLWL